MSFDQTKVESLYPGAGGLMHEAMLIWKLPAGKENMMSEVCSNGQYFGEEKIDGAWYQIVIGRDHKPESPQIYLFGRTKSKVTGLLTEKGQNVPHILSALSCLPPQTVIIGEVYYDGCTAKDTVSITGCLPQEAIRRQNDPKGRGLIKYYIHDIIFYDGVNLMQTGAWDRYRILKAIYEKHNLSQYSFLRLATIVETGIEEEVARILNSGGEGMVLKKRDAIYSPDKRPAHNTIKFKQMDDTDLVCTRCIDPTREYTGKELDTWQYFDSDGTPVTKPYALGWKSAIGIGGYNDQGELVEIGTVSSGLTDEDKAAMGENPDAFVGKVVALHCMSRDKKEQSLRHPVFKGWRDDKNAEDCKLSEIFSR